MYFWEVREVEREFETSSRENIFEVHVFAGYSLRMGFEGFSSRMSVFDQAREGHLVDALAPRGEEGRGRLRKAPGNCQRMLIRRSPNGATRPVLRVIVV